VPPPRFGTDGVRGVANTELTPELALLLGRAAARTLRQSTYLLGRDTRSSGSMLSAALAAGLASEGCDVIDVGVIPTPGIAYLAAERNVPAAMISASHNAYTDNGIKFFGSGGTKLSVDTEHAIRTAIEHLETDPEDRTSQVGIVTADGGLIDDYTKWLGTRVDLRGLRIGDVVVDCANGAASAVAPDLLAELGISHRTIFSSPDGMNINHECGSTHLEPLADEVRRTGAAMGIAFDGDADRMLAVDEMGSVVDGDHLLALFAKDLLAAGRLPNETIVVTVMSNLGLRLALEEAAIAVVETPVGDRHVADALDAGGLRLGGEQSGHLIFREHASTGDGILTALLLIELVGRRSRPLSELASEAMTRLPQVLINVAVGDPLLLDRASAVWEAVERVNAELGASGRVLLRSSGTESCVRVMVEAPSHQEAERTARHLAEIVQDSLS
jgi:phosphoglucosamine mutase